MVRMCSQATNGKALRPAGVTAAELWNLGRGRRCELICGKVVEMAPTGGEHGSVAVNATLLLGAFVKAHGLGNVSTGETGYRVASAPDTVRAPDLGFVRKSRIPPTGVPARFWEIPPDLALEIVSPGDTYEDVESKAREWIESGVTEVWVLNPRLREVKIHRNGRPVEVCREKDVVRSESLLPGFAATAGEFFVI